MKGITFSPDGAYAYVTDTGAQNAFYGQNYTAPSTMYVFHQTVQKPMLALAIANILLSSYRYNVEEDGTFSGRKTFAYVSPGIPDGVHCDTKGNVYSGAGDGVQVWNPSGTLIGKIYLGRFAANFRFAGQGRMVIAAQTELFYATLAAAGSDPEDQF
jgi:gluconolactonase